jgi:hypothetical protein
VIGGGIVAGWRKSSFSSGSDGANCLELRREGAALLLRESDEPARVLVVRPAVLDGLLRQLREEAP